MANIEDKREAYEHSDARARPIIVAGISLAVLCGLGLIAASYMSRSLEKRERARAEPAWALFEREIPAPPRLQPNPPVELKTWRAEQHALLNSYGWVSRPAGQVRIPIERALELVAQRGVPHWAPTKAPEPVEETQEALP